MEIFGAELFLSFLQGGAPAEVQLLSEEYDAADQVKLSRICFECIVDDRRHNRIYALVAAPAASGGPNPGVLILHGGTQNVQEELAIRYAREGYVAITPELPGIASPDGSVVSSGPWKEVPYGTNHFAAIPDVTASSIYEGIAAALQSFALLEAHPEVRTDALGIRGLSWGGYAAVMTSALLGQRVKAACSIYGSGFYDQDTYFVDRLEQRSPEERTRWLDELDAGRKAHRITAAFQMIAASNDTFFWPPAVMNTLREMSGSTDLVFSPNDDHHLHQLADAWRQELLFFDYWLKGSGEPLPKVRMELMQPAATNTAASVRFIVEGSLPIREATLYYSCADAHWTKRVWQSSAAVRQEGSMWQAELPAETASGEWDVYALAIDERNLSASSDIHRLLVR